MPKISFMTFASSDWKKSKERFKNDLETIQKKYNFFDKSLNWSELDLGNDYHMRFSKYFQDHGFGYWSWKPYAILQSLSLIEDGDFLLYLDGDCFLPMGKMEEFIYKIEQIMDVIDSDKAKIGLTTYIDINGYDITNVAIVKKEILDKFNLSDNEEFLYKYPHIQSGLILMKKNQWTIELIKEWYDFYLTNYETAIRGDYTDNRGQNKGYLHNGGDQAILQCMLFNRRPNIASMNFMYNFGVITNKWG